MQVNQERLRADIKKNASFGATEHDGHGRTALAGTPPNGSARDYFIERLKDAGLDVKVDAVGNIVGRWVPKTADPKMDAVAAGSHLDSVREGGMFDGPLGVYAALESVRAFQDEGVAVERPVEVVCFTEEEGQRFGSLLGSSVASGHTSIEDALAHKDDEGVTLAEGLEKIGYAGEGRVDAEEWDAYVELHIEQGRHLETAGVPIGIVTGITGITQATVNIKGEANHAGTTSMSHRTDALAAASEFVLDIERAANHIVETESESAVGTVGREVVRPNSTNVIPGDITLGVDIRDIDSASITNITGEAKKSLERLENERNVSTSYDTDLDIDPVFMSDRCQDAMRQASDEMKIDAPKLPSGAGHDPMRVADVTDVGMLFARSRDGISHNPKEWTSWSDCATAACILGESIANLASD